MADDGMVLVCSIFPTIMRYTEVFEYAMISVVPHFDVDFLLLFVNLLVSSVLEFLLLNDRCLLFLNKIVIRYDRDNLFFGLILVVVS